MKWIIIGLMIAYVIGFAYTVNYHAKYAQNLVFPYVLIRAAVWPYWWITGKP